jgi:H+-translocating NAD(P) transhydrogenase subunit alpha
MKIAVVAESDAGESQAAATPETVRKMIALCADLAVEPGAETKSGFSMPTMPPPR